MPGGSGGYRISKTKYRENLVWECDDTLDTQLVVDFYRVFYKLTGMCDVVNHRSTIGDSTKRIYVILGHDRAPDRSTDETTT